ncbi:MAG: SDR family oxidoreductase [Microgenomates group bacterium]
MFKIALTGGEGLVGSRIIELLKGDFEFINLPQKVMDITDKEKVFQVIKEINFDFFLHLAAYTNVSQAEVDKETCFKINVEGTKNVFEAVYFKKKCFIYISTDFIFDGKNPPYFEDSKPSPVGVYGQSKYEGEKIVDGEGMIIRIAYPYRAEYRQKLDFFRKFKIQLEKKQPLTLIGDSLMTPTFIDDIAFGLRYLIKNFSKEIFHLVGSNSLSPYEVGLSIAQTFNLDKNLIKKISFANFTKSRSYFPQYSVIKSKKNNFLRMKSFEEGLLEIKKQLKN